MDKIPLSNEDLVDDDRILNGVPEQARWESPNEAWQNLAVQLQEQCADLDAQIERLKIENATLEAQYHRAWAEKNLAKKEIQSERQAAEWLLNEVVNLTVAQRAEKGWLTILEEIQKPGLNVEPIPLLLYCPNCGNQHVDAPNPALGWTDPPHRSHQCQYCLGKNSKPFTRRPADVPTRGVKAIETKGENDSSPVPRYQIAYPLRQNAAARDRGASD